MRSTPGTSSICGEFVKTASSSKKRASSLEGAFNLNTDVICVFLGKDDAVNIGEDAAIHLRLDAGEDGELRTECWKVQLRHFRIELFFQVLDVVLVDLGPQQILQQIQLRQHLDREGARHLEGRMSGSATQIQQSA